MLFPSLFSEEPDTRLPEIHALLLERFAKDYIPREVWDPLTQFIYSMLSSRTKTPESHRVLRRLWDRFGSWDGVRDASVPEIEDTIRTATFPEQKAVWLKIALEQITARCGKLSLDFLAAYQTEKIRQWLEGFAGVGPKTSAAVVNFSTLRRRVLCIDSHHLRVSQRLGLTTGNDVRDTEDQLMRMAPATWDAAMLDEHHCLIKLHGQQLCTFREPRCGACPLRTRCPFAQQPDQGGPAPATDGLGAYSVPKP